jgi:hypothetical protein
MCAGVAGGGLASLTLFNIYVNDVPTPSRHIALSYADDMDVIATFRQWTLLEISQPSLALATAMQDSHQHLEDHRGTLC